MAHFNQLLELVPSSFTYISIGSNPHVPSVDELSDSWDQLMPVFIRKYIHSGSMTCIHFDPVFEHNLEFIKKYYATKYPSLVYVAPSYDVSYHSWISPVLKVFVVCSVFEHPSDDWFLEQMCDTVLYAGGKMVVQEYTGQYLNKTLESAYKKTGDTDAFKKNILFDITYGEASCSTDMSKTIPIYDKNEDFVNFTLFTSAEMLDSLGVSRRLDTLIQKYFINKFKTVLNEHHVNYRRRKVGDSCLFNSAVYDSYADPIYIMSVLQDELHSMFLVFKKMGLIDLEKQAEIDNLMTEYKAYNVYDWYSKVNKLFDFTYPLLHRGRLD